MVDISAKRSPDGKRRREFFVTKGEAEAFRQAILTRLQQVGLQGAGLTNSQVAEAAEAFGIIQSSGLGGLKGTVARIARMEEKIAAVGATIEEALDDYIYRAEARLNCPNFRDWMKDWQDQKYRSGKSDRYVGQIQQVRRRLDGTLGEVALSDIDTRTLQGTLDGMHLTPHMWRAIRRTISPPFAHAAKKGVIKENPAANLIPPELPAREIRVLTPEEAQRLVGACDSDLLPYVAIALFGGIRPKELQRIRWENIDLSEPQPQIAVRGKSAKVKGRGRFVPISDNLLAILSPLAKKEGKIYPGAWTGGGKRSWLTKFKKTRVDAGLFDGWVEDAMRHTFASYFLAMTKDLNALIDVMGHTTSNTAKAHYLGAADLRAAIKFWNIGLKGRAKSASIRVA